MDVTIIDDLEQEMERRDFHYYEARAQDVKLEDITSCEKNANIIRELRANDPNLRDLTIRHIDELFIL
jgi:hypothetical protein